ncbi:MAG: patatin-like phospholipase family protein [Bernardetiaceae bacterium]
MAKQKDNKKHLALALQGGGAHGAFTWGVLDRFLEEEELVLDGFSGTSAGAMNAVLLAYGLHAGTREYARELLHRFWKTVSNYALFSPLQPSIFDLLIGKGNMDFSPGFLSSEITSIFLSPYQLNPNGTNPLRNILLDMIDFDALRACTATKIFVCATNVRRGRAKVFKLDDISVEAVLASACLPYMFKAVEIEGEAYWDGGFMGNPPIYPLIDGTDCSDIMVVQINPINLQSTPTTAAQIRDRMNELSFNSSLMLEMRRIAFVDRLLEKGVDMGTGFRKIYLHNINPENDLAELNISSKLNARWEFLVDLRDLGRTYADQWLHKHFDAIGVRSSCDVRQEFL